MGFPGGSAVKNPPSSAGNSGLIPGFGRSPGGRNGNPFQYSCLGNPMDRGTWWAIVHGVAKGWTLFNDLMIEQQKVMPRSFPGKVSAALVQYLPANEGDTSSIPGLGRSPGGGNGNPLQYSSLKNPMDRRDWWATVYGVTKS